MCVCFIVNCTLYRLFFNKNRILLIYFVLTFLAILIFNLKSLYKKNICFTNIPYSFLEGGILFLLCLTYLLLLFHCMFLCKRGEKTVLSKPRRVIGGKQMSLVRLKRRRLHQPGLPKPQAMKRGVDDRVLYLLGFCNKI